MRYWAICVLEFRCFEFVFLVQVQVGVHIAHLYGQIVVLSPLVCPLDGFSCSQKKYWSVRWFWSFFARLWGKFGQKWQNSISLEPLIVRTWLTPDYDQKSHFSNNVSYNVWSEHPEEAQNSIFILFWALPALVILIWMINFITRI